MTLTLQRGYRAVGQLYFYETLLKKEFPSFAISKVIVCNKADELVKEVCAELKIIFFSWEEFSREDNSTTS